MKISVGIISTVIGLVSCCSVDAEEIRWEEPTQNCDGTSVVGELRYQVHYGPESRSAHGHPVNSENPCEGPGLEDYVYPADPIEVTEGRRLCEVLKQGTWYVTMTAENEAGQTSRYSNEIKIKVEPKTGGAGFSCQTP